MRRKSWDCREGKARRLQASRSWRDATHWECGMSPLFAGGLERVHASKVLPTLSRGREASLQLKVTITQGEGQEQHMVALVFPS